MDNSNSDQASISSGKIKTKDGVDDHDGNQSSLSFCFT
jgi:hypothetical protein